MELLHFTGQVWRPPYEASSQLLQATAGCTHNKCKFYSLYDGTKFRLSPVSETEADLKVIREYPAKGKTGIPNRGKSNDRAQILKGSDTVISQIGETELKQYRNNIKSL